MFVTYLTCNSSSGKSDYKPHGSISCSLVAPQRKDSDTYFGELVLKDIKTGESVADNIRSDIFEGNTARIRNYHKAVKKYNWPSGLSFPAGSNNSITAQNVAADTGNPVDSLGYQQRDNISVSQKALADHSMGRNLYMKNETDPDGTSGKNSVGSIFVGGVQKWAETYTQSINSVSVVYTDGTTESLPIPSSDSPSTIKYDGFYCDYVSNGGTMYFFSTDAKYKTDDGVVESIEIFPIIPFQNNGNGELPYESTDARDDDDPVRQSRFERRRLAMRKYGVDFEQMSRQVFSDIPSLGSYTWNQTYGRKWNHSLRLKNRHATEADYHNELSEEIDIPPYGSPLWIKNYRRSYKENMKNCKKNPRPEQKKFCDENPTEQDYYNGLVDDKQKATEGSKNITDVHFGIFASAKKLDCENCVALLFTLAPALKQMKQPSSVEEPPPTGGGGGYKPPSGGTNDETSYKMNLRNSSLVIDYQFEDWSYCRRFGVADPILYPPGLKNAKYHHGDYTVKETGTIDFDVGDTYHPRDSTFIEERAPSGASSPDDGMFAFMGGTGYIELRVQDRADAQGNPRFLELRLFKPFAKHVVDVIRDGEHGKSGSTGISGGLQGYYGTDPDKPYSDVLVYPISKAAADEIRFFRRERFMRECTMTMIGAVQMEEVKWYQQGWFKIVIIIIGAILAWFTGGQSLVAVLKYLAVVAVLEIASRIITNPYLLAIIQIIALAYGAYTAPTMTLSSWVALGVEAAGVVINAYIAAEMIALQEEMREFRKMVNEKEKEMEKMKLEVGMDEYNTDWMLYMASLAPVENADDFYKRALNTDLNEITLDGEVIVRPKLPSPQE